MSMEIASWSLLLHLLLVMCVYGTEMTENHWESLKDHNYESNKVKMNSLDYPRADVVPNRINVLRLNSMDGDHSKDEIDVHKKAHDSQQHAMDDHHRIHAKDANQEMHTMHVHSNPSSHMDHMDPSTMMFFNLNDLKVGKTMPIYFPKTDLSASPHFLPKEEADLIPFSLKELPYLLQFFSYSQDSSEAKAMENTLRLCEIIGPIKGEIRFCATSLESMLDITRGIFGLGSQIKVVATTHLTKSAILFQNYTILAVPKDISAPNMVACHTMLYPYAVFYCHSQVPGTKLFKVSLGGENGDRVEAAAICHMDTSQWSPNHVSFRVLGIEPGSSPVCHVFPADNLVLVQIPIPVN